MKVTLVKKVLLSLSLCFVSLYGQDAAKTADFIIFSYDRPMQLYALLESTTNFITGLNDIFVIYRTSDDNYEMGYQIIKEDFPHVHYIKQSDNPQADFKPLTLQAFQAGSADYIVFAVDDIIFPEPFLPISKIFRGKSRVQFSDKSLDIL